MDFIIVQVALTLSRHLGASSAGNGIKSFFKVYRSGRGLDVVFDNLEELRDDGGLSVSYKSRSGQ